MIQMPVKEMTPLLIEPPADSLQHILPYYHMAASARCRPLCRRHNLFYLVDDPMQGTSMVLRVSGLRRKEEELAAEALWMCEIRRDTHLMVPRPFQTDAGTFATALSHPLLPRGYYCMAFSYLRGTSPEVKPDDYPVLFRRLGELAAQLHQNSILWSCANRLPRSTIDCDVINESLFEGLDDADLFLRVLIIVRERLIRFGRTPDRFGLIHADLRPENLLVDKDNTSLLDFDDCGYGWFLYDCAASVSGMETNPLRSYLIQAWLEGYRNYRKISREEANELPTFLMLNRLLRLDSKLRTGSLSEEFLRDTAALAVQYVCAHTR
ncbi:phosphotransferase enzyme family protein [Ethanoligenens sp.]|uniref:phosphotransferase enzyme family protein n=1 Tax=Ethanoligenens sp. TaxID=2099655 RepID=UPI0039E7895E